MLRIVSLIASASEIVHALGLTPYQVGRSHECDYPDEIHSLPICTKPSFPITGNSLEIDLLVKERLASALSIYEVFDNVLNTLQPTHIVTQTQCRVCAVSLEDVERALAGSLTSRPKLVALEPNSLEDIWTDIRRLADACGVSATGEEMVFGYQDRIAPNLGRGPSRAPHAASSLHRMARAVNGRRKLGPRANKFGKCRKSLRQTRAPLPVDDLGRTDRIRP